MKVPRVHFGRTTKKTIGFLSEVIVASPIKGWFHVSDAYMPVRNKETGEDENKIGKLIDVKCGSCGIAYLHFMDNDVLQGRDPVHAMDFHMWSQNPPLCSACKGTS